jgi:hypothetical protein
MPKVTIEIHPRLLKEMDRGTKEGKELKQLIDNIPKIVAEELSVPGTEASLTPTEIEVRVETIGPYDITNGKDLMINIIAKDYPERKRNLNERRIHIRDRLVMLAPCSVIRKSYVWVHLSDSSYDEF